MDKNSKKMDVFNGEGDVQEFVTRIHFLGMMKGYVDEKLAYCLAEKLRGPAFQVFMRMSEADQKDFTKLKEELYKEFKREQRNRDMAISELRNRKRLPGESVENFAYQVKDLVKFAYPTFDDTHRSIIAKDYFVSGLSEHMQIWLRASPDFSSKNLTAATTLATSFEIAGIKPNAKSEILNINNPSSIDDSSTDTMG